MKYEFKYQNVVKFSANQLMLLMSDETLASLTVIPNAKKFVERKIGSDLESFRKLSLTMQQRKSKKLADAVIPWNFLKNGKNAAARKKLHQKTRFIAADYVAENFAQFEKSIRSLSSWKGSDKEVLSRCHNTHMYMIYDNLTVQEKAKKAINLIDTRNNGGVGIPHNGGNFTGAVSRVNNYHISQIGTSTFRSSSQIWHMFAMFLFLRMGDTDILNNYGEIPYTIDYSQTYEEFTKEHRAIIDEFITYDSNLSTMKLLGDSQNEKHIELVKNLKYTDVSNDHKRPSFGYFTDLLFISKYNENLASAVRGSTRAELNYLLVRNRHTRVQTYSHPQKYKKHFNTMLQDLEISKEHYDYGLTETFDKYIQQKGRIAQLILNKALSSFLSLDSIVGDVKYIKIAGVIINLQGWLEDYLITNNFIEMEFVLDFYKIVSVIEKHLPDSALRKDSEYYGVDKREIISPAEFFGFFNAIGVSNVFNALNTHHVKMQRDTIMGLCTIIENIPEDEYEDYEESLFSAICTIGSLSNESAERLGFIHLNDLITLYNDKNVNIDMEIVISLLSSKMRNILNENSSILDIDEFYRITWA